jgi:hypothetical protein
MPLHVSGVTRPSSGGSAQMLINKLRKVYQVGVDSLMYHDKQSTKHQDSVLV